MTNNKKYKVEFGLSEKFVIDVLAKNEAEAKDKAIKNYYKKEANGTIHYNQTDSTLQIETVYDVTGTDDPFDPETDKCECGHKKSKYHCEICHSKQDDDGNCKCTAKPE